MERVGDQRQAADRQAQHELDRRENKACDKRYDGGAFLEAHGKRILRGSYSRRSVSASPSRRSDQR
jgi:hypothetical protein